MSVKSFLVHVDTDEIVEMAPFDDYTAYVKSLEWCDTREGMIDPEGNRVNIESEGLVVECFRFDTLESRRAFVTKLHDMGITNDALELETVVRRRG